MKIVYGRNKSLLFVQEIVSMIFKPKNNIQCSAEPITNYEQRLGHDS